MNCILIMTEGPTELGFLKALKDKGLLSYGKEELFYQQIFHARQITDDLQARMDQLPYHQKITIIRVGDTQKDELAIPKRIRRRIDQVYRVCTLPEFEVLFLLNENRYSEWEKSNEKKPSSYYKRINKSYQKGERFSYDYFSAMSSDEIVELINTYCQKKAKVCENRQVNTPKVLLKKEVLEEKGIAVECLLLQK